MREATQHDDILAIHRGCTKDHFSQLDYVEHLAGALRMLALPSQWLPGGVKGQYNQTLLLINQDRWDYAHSL